MQQDEKRARIEVTLATSESHQLSQIESEFQILKSLIPNIADRKQINEVNEIEMKSLTNAQFEYFDTFF